MGVLTEKTLLIDIELNTNDIPTMSTDIGIIATDIGTIASDTTSLVDQIGEVQAIPTQYTLLERTSNIENNTMMLVNNTNRFSQTITLTRPANTTPYALGDIINQDASTTLPFIDLSTYLLPNNRNIRIDTILVSSTTVSSFNLIFSPSDTFGAQTFSDNDVFNPAFDDFDFMSILRTVATIETWDIATPIIYSQQYSSQSYILKTDNAGKFYVALIVRTAFTPTSAQKFSITLKGTLL